MKHLHTLGILIGRAKTRKTLCGLRRPEHDLAQGAEEADCSECRRLRDVEIQGMQDMLKYAEKEGVVTDKLRASIAAFAAAARYTNAEILR